MPRTVPHVNIGKVNMTTLNTARPEVKEPSQAKTRIVDVQAPKKPEST